MSGVDRGGREVGSLRRVSASGNSARDLMLWSYAKPEYIPYQERYQKYAWVAT